MMTTAAIDRAALWPRLRSTRHTSTDQSLFINIIVYFSTTIKQSGNTHIQYIKLNSTFKIQDFLLSLYSCLDNEIS